MAKDNKTITLWELPEINAMNDNDIFVLTDGNKTYKITGKHLIQYVRNHDDISKHFVHQESVGAAGGIAALDASSKLYSENIPFGVQFGSVYEGSSGKALEAALDSHTINKSNPHSVTKAQLGLENVDNTADIHKPVSHAQQSAIDTKADNTAFVSHAADSTVHITSAERDHWNASNTQKHNHPNRSLLDGITAALITAWNNAVSHVSDNVKHITGNERALWNTVTNKVTKENGKTLSSNDYSNTEKAKLQGIEDGANYYRHPNTDGSKHIPPNGTANGGKYLKSTSAAGSYEWGALTKGDVESALGYTPGEAEKVQTQLNNIYTKNEANALLNDKLSKTGDAGNTTVAYTQATTLSELVSGEKQSAAFGKLKVAVKNVISFARLLGTTNISSIGGGTVTGALAALNSNINSQTTGYKPLLTAAIINDPTITVPYTGNAESSVCEAIGLPHGWHAISHMAHINPDGYCTQIAYPYTAADPLPKYRYCRKGVWTQWTYLDGGSHAHIQPGPGITSNEWLVGHHIIGWGVVVQIPSCYRINLTVTNGKIFIPELGWKALSVAPSIANRYQTNIIAFDSSGLNLKAGASYIVTLDARIT